MIEGIAMMIAFMIGFTFGKQTEPVKAIKQHFKKEIEEDDEIDRVLKNIDSYDGTELGQEEIK